MLPSELGTILFSLSILLGSVHFIGYIFDRLRQPRLIGEILTGVVLGPFVLGAISPAYSNWIFGNSDPKVQTVLEFFYWSGLMLLMFVSGTETQRLMAKENFRQIMWLLIVGLAIPFIAIVGAGTFDLFPIGRIVGRAQDSLAALLVFAIAVTVTSIPVISRIFLDLGIIRTKFASLILGTAIIEDMVLWITLAVATGLVGSAGSSGADIVQHVGATLLYTVLGLTVFPKIFGVINRQRWNLFLKASPVGYLFLVLFLYGATGASLGINVIFAAFLAGFGIVGGFNGTERSRFAESIAAMSKVSFGIFIPVYFVLVGKSLVFNHIFSISLFLTFLVGSSALALVGRGLASYFAGFKRIEIANIAIVSNARGGPGIVVASVAYEAGIINGSFYTTMVLTAIITSQIAGVWLRYVLHRGWPLLSTPSTNELPDRL